LEEDEGLEDDVHFQMGDFQVPCQYWGVQVILKNG